MRKILIITVLGILLPFLSFSQFKDALKETFLEAEYYILYEDYNEALALYQNLYNSGYDNAYINHRIGECYLQIPGQKEKSIPYLEKACENVSITIKEGSIKETKAPLRTIFYLAIAYQTNDELDKAIETFNKFKDRLAEENIYNIDYVERQIESCETAKNLIEAPLNVSEENIGDLVNDQFPNIRPVISEDENSMVYISKRKFYDAIFYSTKENGKWLTPINITPDLNSDGNYYSCHLSCDGKVLILLKDENYNKDIYISYIKDKKWSVPKKLNRNINTKSQETFASISKDKKTLYFVSDRKGGFGGTDIYKSELDELTQDWGKAVNLGPVINTAFNEENPIVCENESTIYFSSQGHYNMGGFDIFHSQKTDNGWTKPENLGYPLNTTDDNISFFPIKNGSQLYMAKFDKNGFGKEDIIKIKILSSK
jgi:tetratricopeptide (TPR) repeat protein